MLIIGTLKNACVLSFFNGALLTDKKNISIQQTKNSHTTRILKFTNIQQVHEINSKIIQFIEESIKNIESDKKPLSKSNKALELPIELKQEFDNNAEFKDAFFKLTPGRQKGYLLHFSSAKQSKTVISRIQKNIDRIIDGYGFHDCTCGLSKRMPNCDGSHKQLQ